MKILSVPERLEAEVKRATTAFYRSFDIEVVNFTDNRATRNTPGWPDVFCFCVRKGCCWVHEMKRERRGVQSIEQSRMQEWFTACGIPYLLGGTQEAHDHLVRIGVLEP